MDSNLLVVATLLATIPVALLSYVRDTFSDRASNDGPVNRKTDNATTALFFISTCLSLLVAVVGEMSGEQKRLILIMLRISVGALISGVQIFLWAEQPQSVAIGVTALVCVAWMGITGIKLKYHKVQETSDQERNPQK